MTDEKFVFQETNKERRNTGVFHKKGGSKSRKCSLPHDNLTPSQLNKLNGPVLSLYLDKPMAKKDWLYLRADQKKLYIEHLIETYKANDRMIAAAVGCSANYVCLLRKELGIKSAGRGGASRLSTDRMEAWLKFMHPENHITEEPVEEPVSEPECVEALQPIKTQAHVYLNGTRSTRIEQTDFAITVSGVKDWAEMLDYFELLPIREGGTATVHIELHQGK